MYTRTSATEQQTISNPVGSMEKKEIEKKIFYAQSCFISLKRLEFSMLRSPRKKKKEGKKDEEKRKKKQN